MSESGNLITRNYSNFRGVDFLNDPGIVSLQRSPDALNVWKNYRSSQGNCIETRPGYKELVNFGERINGFFAYKRTLAIIHLGTKLYKWTNFPDIPSAEEKVLIHTDMNDSKSQMYLFKGILYINDGMNFLKYDGNTLLSVSVNAYVPTTSIGRSPSGGGELYEDINLLTGQRINTFLADGTSKEYCLDATNIDSVDKVMINDVELVNTYYVTNFEVDLSKGKITFTNAPTAPSTMGKDNVSIKFTKNIDGYKERIEKCTIAKVFDNRIFFSGNPNYPNAIFHCSVGYPEYISDLDYYEDGIETKIKDLVVGNNSLWVLKESNQNRDTIFYHTPTTDTEYGRVYPSSQGNISIGCYSCAINYNDTIVFLSREGLESITSSIDSLQMVTHKSSLVDSKMTNASNFSEAIMGTWQGYLLIAIDNEIFLADNRQLFLNNNIYEYEWYYWKIKDNITVLKEYEEKLYFGTDNGKLYYFDGTNDNGELLESYWTTPRDVFKYIQYLKTTNKRGAIAKIKNIMNGKMKIDVKSNRKDWKLLKEVSLNGFDFNNIDFSNFSFSTDDNSYVSFKIKLKKIIDYQLKFYSDEIDKPFGLYSVTLEAFLGSFVKRS